MTDEERKKMMNLADMIEGEINRMCVTKDLSELDSMALHASKNIEKLQNMRYAELKGENKKECSTCKSDNSHENCLGCIEYGHWEQRKNTNYQPTMKDLMIEELEKIKQEVEEEKIDIDLNIGQERLYNNAINDVMQIIDNHISKLKGEQEWTNGKN